MAKRESSRASPPLRDPEIDEAVARAKVVIEAGRDEELHERVGHSDLLASNPNAHNPPQVYTVGARVIPADKITERLIKEATEASAYWYERVRAPRRHAIKEGIKAEAVWADKIRKAIELKSRARALEKVTDEDMGKALEAVSPGDFESGVRRKQYKIIRRFGVLQPLYEMLAKILDTFPVATDAEREAKMKAARKGMIAVGQARRGEITVEEARRIIEGLRGR